MKSKLIEISRHFYSAATGSLFTTCLNCDHNLLESHKPYIIEKAIKKYPKFNTDDTIFEYAICLECMMKMREHYSTESMQKLNHYFEQNFQPRNLPDTSGEPSINDLLSSCVIKGTPAEQLTEYQIAGYCIGDKMEIGEMPFMIGGPALEEMMQLMSSKTLGEMDDFVGRHLGIPPDLRKLLPEDKILIL